MGKKHEHCPECAEKNKKWYKEKSVILAFVIVSLLAVSYIVTYLNPLFSALIDYIGLIWWAILLGFFLGGVIEYFVPRGYVEKYLGRHEKKSVFYAVFFGFLMSACSHGILAIAIELYKKGANTSSVIAFLLASPWANLPITILFFGFFGPKAFLLILSAIVIAIITGLIYQALERKKMVECEKCGIESNERFSIIKDVRTRMKKADFSRESLLNAAKGIFRGSWSLSKMVLWWILIGIIIASFARAFVPQHFFMAYMGATLLGMVAVLVLATIIEVCSEGSAPMAFEIFNQTGAFGNSFVFLMAGVATDYTEIGLVWHNIGKRAALWLPAITVPQILLLGYFFNFIA
ncbi:permease [Candidatus Woesearchaeota archaeon]|nr:permease [Candidatus Woesearchaeota archaeon]